jgi:hypothetical protein
LSIPQLDTGLASRDADPNVMVDSACLFFPPGDAFGWGHPTAPPIVNRHA